VIVVDANILFPFIVNTETTQAARAIRLKDADWRLPSFWRVEFGSILLKYIRAERIERARADLALARAIELYGPHESPVSEQIVLRTAVLHEISMYDAVYLALAQELGTSLVTNDKALVRQAQGRAILMEDYIR